MHRLGASRTDCAASATHPAQSGLGLLTGLLYEILRRPLRTRRLPLLSAQHIIECRGHHGTFPAKPQCSHDRAGNTVAATVSKRRLSDIVYQQMRADAKRLGTGWGGHAGATFQSSAADPIPAVSTSEQSLPEPASH